MSKLAPRRLKGPIDVSTWLKKGWLLRGAAVLALSLMQSPAIAAQSARGTEDLASNEIVTKRVITAAYSESQAPTRGADDRRPQPPRGDEGRSEPRRPPWSGPAGTISIWPKRDRQEPPTAATLAETGPRTPTNYRIGEFPVQAYVRGGWPFVLDFLPQPDTRTWVDVEIDGRIVESRLLDRDGRSGRRVIGMVLAEHLSSEPRAGAYIIRSAKTRDDRVLTDARGNDIRAHVEIYGIGAGPKAVGSVALDDVVFEPSNLRFQPAAGNVATYSFNSRSEFNRASIEILKFENRGGEIRVDRVKTENVLGVSLGRSPPRTWDGSREGSTAPSFGVHRMQVRAWFNAEDRSWVGSWSPNAVTVVK